MKNVFIAAGGTGGHINAALSIGDELSANYNVIYFTGQRHLDYKLFKNKNVIHLMSRPLRSLNPIRFLINFCLNLNAFCLLFFYLIKYNPRFIVGAGGYICGPVLLSGYFMLKKIFIIEQNAVAGLTNKLLARVSNKVFTSFEKVKGMESVPSLKVFNLGNPIRKEIQYSENKVEGQVNILVFGGSLGASQINNALREVINNLDNSRFYIKHQVGRGNLGQDIDGLKNYEQKEYIDDMGKAYKEANIIISRAGASTISELRVIKKPCILIPFPAAVDNHQYYNALELKEEGKFLVEIIDHTKNTNDIAQSIIDSIYKIDKENSYFADDDIMVDSSREIIKEIEKCLE